MDDIDLDALFEQTLAQANAEATQPPAPAATPAAPPSVSGVTAKAGAAAAAVAASVCQNADPDGVCRTCTCGSARDLRERVGRLTRDLHESLKELQLDKTLADMAVEIPDARNRLKYVVEMCERSAQKVLDTLDELGPLQDASRKDSAALLARWDRLMNERRRPDEGFMALFEDTRAVLGRQVQRAERSASLHTDIMMAQDFQDLTGQVCRKIEGITERIETQLVSLLLDTAPEEHRARHQEMLEGPQVVSGRNDAVASQTEVDDLLSQLGF